MLHAVDSSSDRKIVVGSLILKYIHVCSSVIDRFEIIEWKRNETNRSRKREKTKIEHN